MVNMKKFKHRKDKQNLEEKEVTKKEDKKVDSKQNKKENKNTKKPKRKVSKSAVILTVGLIVIIVPILVFLFILAQAYFGGGKPINGNRFSNDLDPQITKENISTLKDNVGTIEGIEEVSINLKTATFKVFVDVKDDVDEEKAKEITNNVLTKITETLPLDTYFKSQDGKKMYDLEIHLYNLMPPVEEGQTYIYYILTKNAAMKEPKVQIVSKPLDSELAEELRQDVENRIKAAEEEVEKQESTDVQENTDQQTENQTEETDTENEGGE